MKPIFRGLKIGQSLTGVAKSQDYCFTKRIDNGHTLDPQEIPRPARTSQENFSPKGNKKKTIPTVQPASGLADRQTPLIRNFWYVLDWAADVKRKLKNRMVLNQDLVYFRNKAGYVTVLQNRCGHRCFPLHRSTLHKKDDTIQCGYHGLTYGIDGTCVKIPSAMDLDPSYVKIQSYPVVEKGPMIWIWAGEP